MKSQQSKLHDGGIYSSWYRSASARVGTQLDMHLITLDDVGDMASPSLHESGN